ncbi:MAG: FAD-binding oxidoreductase [Gammaproteobacteria bacterium]|nr:FAD-binding oxidoreductase [Gammaproteobacteria bacterium]MDH3857487.1 FAD-binding oxidoreductase [Gammaproteobacteria bacterium]
MEYDFIVAGGGLVGSSVAYGLAQENYKVAVLDGGDRSLRASRGNFGLVWVQGKGWDYAPYANWTGQAANLWPEFVDKLTEKTGIGVDYQRSGGMHFCLSGDEWDERIQEMEMIRQHTDGSFEYEMLDHDQLKKYIPQISKAVLGASYSAQDGHVNPLYLLQALHQGMDYHQVKYFPNQVIDNIETREGGFFAYATEGVVSAEKIVLCAGLGNRRLGEMLGMEIPVVVDRGEIMITERLQPFLNLPTLHVRQTAEGTVQIGDSHEDVGLDDGTNPAVLKKIAQRAVLMFPFLERVRLVRAWGALRIMTPDHNPIYQQSESCPGAYTVTCHSGVTLAAMHAGPVVEWIAGSGEPDLINQFGTDRFDVSLN